MINEPVLTATCDECFDELTLELTPTARGWDDRDVDKQIERNDWVQMPENDGRTFCPTCARKLGLYIDEDAGDWGYCPMCGSAAEPKRQPGEYGMMNVCPECGHREVMSC